MMAHLVKRIAGLAVLALACLNAVAATQDIVLGQVLSSSGTTGELGRDIQAGSEACVNWVNEQGGVAGRRLRLITKDDGGVPDRAVANAQSLMDRDGAVALLGPMGPAVTVPLLDWATRAQVLVVGPHSGDVVSRSKEWTTAYFLTANHSAEAQKLAAHIVALGVMRVVQVYSENDFGRRALEALEESMAVAGVDSSRTIDIPAVFTQKDISNAVEMVLAAKPQAIVLATSGEATLAILKSINAHWDRGGRGMSGIYGLSFAATPRDLETLGSTARGLAVSQVLPPITDIRHRLVSIYQAATTANPALRTPGGLEGCLGPLVFAEALKRKTSDFSRSGVLSEFRWNRAARIGNLEVPLADRDRPGLRYVDIVTFGADGRLVH